MAVRAKMTCIEIKRSTYMHHENGTYEERELREVRLQPVYTADSKDPNREWASASPSGEVKLTIANRAAFEQIELGKTYFVDFTPAT